jgi:hypothetical protein
MRVGIIQSCYIPWRGYFDFIDSVDLFIIFDDIQYPQGRSWRNRNQIKTRSGLKWLTVPVSHGASHLNIDQVEIGDSGKPWQASHRGQLCDALGQAPYFREAMALWEEGVQAEARYLSRLNVRLTEAICRYLEITTPIVLSSGYTVNGEKTARLIALLKQVGAKTYVSGPAAKDYLDLTQFRDNNIRLEYKSYRYEPYPQLWGEFAGAVTVLDLIANTGPASRRYLNSQEPNEIAVP